MRSLAFILLAVGLGWPGFLRAEGPRLVLLMPDAAACASIANGPGVTRLGLPGIGHGWDIPVVLVPAGALLPDPAGAGLRRARPDPIATEAVAEEVAAWLAARLGGAAP